MPGQDDPQPGSMGHHSSGYFSVVPILLRTTSPPVPCNALGLGWESLLKSAQARHAQHPGELAVGEEWGV